jgi:hypothetical protein
MENAFNLTMKAYEWDGTTANLPTHNLALSRTVNNISNCTRTMLTD